MKMARLSKLSIGQSEYYFVFTKYIFNYWGLCFPADKFTEFLCGDNSLTSLKFIQPIRITSTASARMRV